MLSWLNHHDIKPVSRPGGGGSTCVGMRGKLGCHKPTMTGDAFNPTNKNGDDLGIV